MKDMSDVVSYLNNVLGPHHDLTIAARQQYESSNITENNTRNFNDAEQCILWALSQLIFELPERHFSWTSQHMSMYISEFVLDHYTLQELVEECLVGDELINDYQSNTALLDMLDADIKDILKDEDHVDELMTVVEKDLAGDCLEVWFGN